MTKTKSNDAFTNPFMDYMKTFQDMNSWSSAAPQMPNFDTTAWAQNQRRSAEAASAANQIITEGLQALMRTSAQNMQETSSEMFRMMKDCTQNVSSNPEQSTAQNIHSAKCLTEKCLSDARETMQMCNKMSVELFDLMSKNINETMGECCKATSTKKSAPKAA